MVVSPIFKGTKNCIDDNYKALMGNFNNNLINKYFTYDKALWFGTNLSVDPSTVHFMQDVAEGTINSSFINFRCFSAGSVTKNEALKIRANNADKFLNQQYGSSPLDQAKWIEYDNDIDCVKKINN